MTISSSEQTESGTTTPPNNTPPATVDATGNLENEVPWDGLPSGLDSGDIVLFNRRCFSMPFRGAALCCLAKVFSNSAWDHVGMVIREPKTGELLFLEADFGGVKLRSLAERVKRSQSKEIAVRKLSHPRNDTFRKVLHDFAINICGTPYNSSPNWLLGRMTDQKIKKEREHYHALYIQEQSRLKGIEADMKNALIYQTGQSVLLDERKKTQDKLKLIEAEMKNLQMMGQNNTSGQSNSSSPTVVMQLSEETLAGSAMPTAVMFGDYSKDLSTVFCSELVAAAYQHIGLLNAYPPAESYNPIDFSSESNRLGLSLKDQAALDDEIFLRISQQRVREGKAREREGQTSGISVFKKTKQFRGVSADDLPSRESRRIIRDVLKRSSVYVTIPDELKRSAFVKSFKARILEPGEVVFNQGEYDQYFYVIESGRVDRFVGKGLEPPMHTNSLGPRSSFGTTGFVFLTPRSATIRARERTLLWVVDRDKYEEFKDASMDPEAKLAETDRQKMHRILKNHFLFRRLDRLGTKEVNSFFPVKFRAGEAIFKQGDAGDNFYIIKSGEVERWIRHPRKSKKGVIEEDETTLAKTMTSGQSFGELSLMYDAPRGSTVRARTDVECFAISNEQFHKLNLGRGTEFLRTRFQKSASVTRKGDKYMTTNDFLTKIANADGFREEDRERLSWLLVSLVSNNRERDPVRALQSKQNVDDDETEDVLMNFWDFARLDIVLNHPSAEQNLAFQLADSNNSGFVSFEEMQTLLQVYSDNDESARQMLNGETDELLEAFGKDGSNILSADQFNALSKRILPKQFVKDVEDIAKHMRNVQINPVDEDDISFLPDQSMSMLGSNFVSATSRSAKGMDMKQRDAMLSMAISSAVSRTVVAPLERLKILMQTDSAGKFRGLVRGFRTMVREDTSVRRSLFRGNANNVARIVPTVLSTSAVTQLLKERVLSGDEKRFRNVETLALAGASGMITAALLYPLEFARGRLSVQNATFQPYAGTLSALRESVAQDGLRSLYRGVTPSMLGTFAYTGIPFMMFESLRPVLPKREDGSHMPSAASSIISSTIVSVFVQSVALPLDTVRRRMQVAGFGNDQQVRTFSGTVAEMFRTGGVRAFYRGMVPNLLKITPLTAASYFAMEYSRNLYINGAEQAERWVNHASDYNNR